MKKEGQKSWERLDSSDKDSSKKLHVGYGPSHIRVDFHYDMVFKGIYTGLCTDGHVIFGI